MIDNSSNRFKAGVAVADITPPVGCPMAGYAERTGPSIGVHTPLYAKIVVFDDGQTRAAIVTLDLIASPLKLTEEIRKMVQEKGGVPRAHTMVCCSHTHGGPDPRVDAPYLDLVVEKIGGAAFVATQALLPASLGIEMDEIDFNVNRRLVDESGVARFLPNPKGACDRRVKVVRVDGEDSLVPRAVLFHCCCHANVFRGENERITADFPGVAQAFIERSFGGQTTALFLQGCSGNVRANLPAKEGGFRNGDDVDMTWAGWSLGAATIKAVTKAAVREFRTSRIARPTIRSVFEIVQISGREGGTVACPLQVMRVGDIGFVGLPGEPFVEYGLQIEEALKAKGHILVMECTNDFVGYIPTAEAYARGGYEPSKARYAPQGEEEILAAVCRLAQDVE